MEKFSDHIEPTVNAYLARFQLSQLKQHFDEAVDDFFARCRVAAAKCKFTDIVEMNTRLIEQLIIGTQHDYVRGKLLEKGHGLASLDEAKDIAKTFETTKAHAAQFQSYGSPSLCRSPQFMDSAERRRTRNALVVDVGTPHKDFAQQRDPPVVAVGGKITGILCVPQRSRQLRSKVASMDINDRHKVQRRVTHSRESNGEHYR